MKITFDFEKPIADLIQQIEKVKQMEDKNKLDMSATVAELESKLKLPSKKYTATLPAGKRYKYHVIPKGHIPYNTLS